MRYSITSGARHWRRLVRKAANRSRVNTAQSASRASSHSFGSYAITSDTLAYILIPAYVAWQSLVCPARPVYVTSQPRRGREPSAYIQWGLPRLSTQSVPKPTRYVRLDLRPPRARSGPHPSHRQPAPRADHSLWPRPPSLPSAQTAVHSQIGRRALGAWRGDAALRRHPARSACGRPDRCSEKGGVALLSRLSSTPPPPRTGQTHGTAAG